MLLMNKKLARGCLASLLLAVVSTTCVNAEQVKPQFPEKQRFCPVYTDRPVFFSSQNERYDGVRVYFSNEDAALRFLKSPEAYLDKELLPQLKNLKLPVPSIEQQFCPVYRTRKISSRNPFARYQGKKVYFFDDLARRKWEFDPEKYLDEDLLPQLADEENEEEPDKN